MTMPRSSFSRASRKDRAPVPRPEISLLGANDIPIRHELEFELTLSARRPEPRTPPLRHLALAVRDQERSRRFYGTYFGFESARPCPDGVLMLRNRDGFSLALGQAEEAPPLPAFFHFGFDLPDPQGVALCGRVWSLAVSRSSRSGMNHTT
jgi:hypothetical protein